MTNNNNINDNNIDTEAERRALALRSYEREKKAYDSRPKTARQTFGWIGRKLTGRNLKRTVIGSLAAAMTYVAVGQFCGGVNNELLDVKTPTGGSSVVAWLHDSIKREYETGWCPSSNFVYPYHMQYDRCAFQSGQREIWLRVSQRLQSEVTRAGIANPNDPDITQVQKIMNMGDYWSTLFWLNPALSTKASLKLAVGSLDSFQQRLAKGEAHYYSQIDNMSYIVGDVTNVLGDEQGQLQAVAGRAGLFVGPETRTATYRVLGSMNAVCGLLHALNKDFAKVITYQSSTGIVQLTIEKACDDIGYYPPVLNNVGGKVAQVDADLSAATNQLRALQDALAAEAKNPQARMPGGAFAAPSMR